MKKREPLSNINISNNVNVTGHDTINSIIKQQQSLKNIEKDKELIDNMSKRIKELETDANNSRDIANALQLKLSTQIEEYEELRIAKIHEANLLREAAKLLSTVEADRSLLEAKIKENTIQMTKELNEIESKYNTSISSYNLLSLELEQERSKHNENIIDMTNKVESLQKAVKDAEYDATNFAEKVKSTESVNLKLRVDIEELKENTLELTTSITLANVAVSNLEQINATQSKQIDEKAKRILRLEERLVVLANELKASQSTLMFLNDAKENAKEEFRIYSIATENKSNELNNYISNLELELKTANDSLSFSKSENKSLTEVNSQLTSDLDKYKILFHEIQADNNNLLVAISSITVKADDTESKLLDKSNQLTVLLTNHNAVETQNSNLTHQIELITLDLTKSKSNFESISAAKAGVESELSSTVAELESVSAAKAGVEAELSSTVAELESVSAAKAGVESELSSTVAELESISAAKAGVEAELSSTVAELESVSAAKAGVEAELSSTVAELESISAAKAGVEAELSSTVAELESVTGAKAGVEAELSIITSKANTLARDLEASQSAYADLESANGSTEGTLAILVKEKSCLESQVASLESDLSSATSSISSLETTLSSTVAELESVSAAKAGVESELSSTVAELESVTAVNVDFGLQLNIMTNENNNREVYLQQLAEELHSSSEDARKLQTMLNDVITEKNELEEISNSMKKRIELFEEQYNELQITHNETKESYVNMEGELALIKNAYTQAENSRQQLADEVSSMAGVFEEAEVARGTTLERLLITEKHIQDLDLSLQAMTEKYTTTLKELSDSKIALEDTTSAKEKIELELQSMIDKVASAEDEKLEIVVSMNNKANMAERRAREIDIERGVLQERLTSALTELKDIKYALSNMEAMNVEMESKFLSQLENAQNNHDDTELNELKSKYEEQCFNYTQEILNLQSEIKVLQSDLVLAREYENARFLLEEQARNAVTASLEGKEKDADALIQDLISCKIAYANINHELDNAKQKIKSLIANQKQKQQQQQQIQQRTDINENKKVQGDKKLKNKEGLLNQKVVPLADTTNKNQSLSHSILNFNLFN